MARLIALTSVAMIAFAANSVLARLALLPEGADPLAYTGIRLASGAVALATILAVFRRGVTVSGSWSASGALFAYALAFSLAGIAGAVRFRNSLKSSGDALFILLAVAIGLSAGIGAVELAAVVSIAFNYCFIALWMVEYGERKGMKRYLADYDGIDESAPPEPDKKK